MLLLILRDLQYRKWRVGLTVILMAIVMMLLFLMAGLVEEFNTEPYRAADRAGGEMNWVVAQGTGGPFTSPQPVDAELFAGIDGEEILVSASAVGPEQIRLIGRSYAGVTDEPPLIAGRYPATSGEVVVDESLNADVGDTIDVGGTPASVVGVTRDSTVLAGVPLAFATLDFTKEATLGGQELILGKLIAGTPDVAQQFKILTPEMVGDDALLPLEDAIASVALVRALLWLITIIIIAAIIYITALERTRDFAVLKAVGGKTRDLSLSLLVQGLVMTLLAVVIAGIMQSFVAPSFPMTVRVPSDAWLQIGGGAALASLAAGAAGVMHVRATSPAEAFG